MAELFGYITALALETVDDVVALDVYVKVVDVGVLRTVQNVGVIQLKVVSEDPVSWNVVPM
jgi:hypothetical protein